MRELAKRGVVLVTLAAALVPGATMADDVSGANEILCASVEATVCTFEGDCEVGSPWLWNIPSFVTIDLDAKTVSTTEAAAEKRSSPFRSVESDDEHLVLQGYENGRAFSFVIHRPTGELTVAVARDGVAVSVFGMCMPYEPDEGRRAEEPRP